MNKLQKKTALTTHQVMIQTRKQITFEIDVNQDLMKDNWKQFGYGTSVEQI